MILTTPIHRRRKARAWLRSFLRHHLKAPTLYWARIELTTRVNRLLQRLLLRRPERLKRSARWLNVGCGSHGIRSEDWFNVDALRLPGVDYALDAGRPLPFPNGRFQGIFSEHFVEHLPDDEGRRFFEECHRLLASGGVLRIVVPDGELYLRGYLEDREWLVQRARGNARTPMEVVNQVFRQGSEHQYCYDGETLLARLRDAGFDTVERARFGAGQQPELIIDRAERADESLYVEARRGGDADPSA